jgi:hypothetical protein
VFSFLMKNPKMDPSCYLHHPKIPACDESEILYNRMPLLLTVERKAHLIGFIGECF